MGLVHPQVCTMTPDTNTSPLNALMIAVKALKRQSPSIEISSSEKVERVSNLIERLALFQRTPVAPAMPPIARSAQEM
jgi:hypothetical protein